MSYLRCYPSNSALAHGSEYTISGVGLGTKNAQRVWADLDGSKAAALTYGSQSGTTNVTYTDTTCPRPRRTYAARVNWRLDDAYYSYTSVESTRWFAQYWVRVASNLAFGQTASSKLSNVKFFRMHPEAGTYVNVGYIWHTYTATDATMFFAEDPAPGAGTVNKTSFGAPDTFFTRDAWHCVQWEYGDNSANDAADGHTRLWIDGVLRDSWDTLITRDSAYAAQRKHFSAIGFYDSDSSDDYGEDAYIWYSDIYVDDSWQRVMLCNSADYAAATLREPQPIVSWADTAIHVTGNAPGFTLGQSAWLHVIGADGAVIHTTPVTVGN